MMLKASSQSRLHFFCVCMEAKCLMSFLNNVEQCFIRQSYPNISKGQLHISVTSLAPLLDGQLHLAAGGHMI